MMKSELCPKIGVTVGVRSSFPSFVVLPQWSFAKGKSHRLQQKIIRIGVGRGKGVRLFNRSSFGACFHPLVGWRLQHAPSNPLLSALSPMQLNPSTSYFYLDIFPLLYSHPLLPSLSHLLCQSRVVIPLPCGRFTSFSLLFSYPLNRYSTFSFKF